MPDPYSDLPLFKGDTAICRECGECCKHFSMYMPTQEAWRIKNLVKDYDILVEDLGDGFSRVKFNSPCKFLIVQNGIHTCRIHDSDIRPRLCAAYPQSFIDDLQNTPMSEIEGCRILLWKLAATSGGDHDQHT